MLFPWNQISYGPHQNKVDEEQTSHYETHAYVIPELDGQKMYEKSQVQRLHSPEGVTPA